MSNAASPVESRALSLLGSGVGPAAVSMATGLSESRISQLLSDPQFSAQVLEMRFMTTVAHAARDQKYDAIEDQLLEKMKYLLPLMMRPMEVLKAIGVINMAKRRAQIAPESMQANSGVVNLTLPISIIQSHTQNNVQVNIHNQVVKVEDVDLVTIQSGAMARLLETAKVRNGNEQINNHRTESIGSS